MDRMICWNVRGANNPDKMKAIQQYLAEQQVGLACLLETKVKSPNLGLLYNSIFNGWCFTSNVQKHYNGRIVLAWNPNSFTVGLEQMTDQIIHCVIKPSGALEEFFYTFIYAHNDAKLRDSLWETLSKLNSKLRGPWLMMGDFNCVINIEERIGSAVRQKEIDPMRRCISECELQDIPYSGHFYTWSNKQVTEDRVWSKLDRAMANEKWLEVFQSANAVFLTEGCSDHCPALLRMNFDVGKGRKPFKYFQMWQQAPDYSQRIQQAEEGEIRGTAMFKVIQKLKRVKTSLKELNQKGFNNLQAEDTKTYQELVEIQEALHKDLLNTDLMQKEKDAVYKYNQAYKNYMQFLRQKAKALWIREGDDNTALFHSCIRKRTLQNNVYAIRDMGGVMHDSPEGIQGAFVDYYKELLGKAKVGRAQVHPEIIKKGPVLQDDQKRKLIHPFTKEEVRKAIFSIPRNKSPGPDGFGTHFYKHNWDLIGEEVTNAILDFFELGKLLKEINNTFLY
ncbi:hypothetical protein RDABS01_031035 [Bienertia sinuspersici]